VFVEPGIEVVLLSGPDSPSAPARLMAGLAAQGLQPSAVTSITESDPGRARGLLIDALTGAGAHARGPDAAPGPEAPGPDARGADAPDRDGHGVDHSGAGSLPPIALLAADVVVNGTALGAVLDDPRVRTGVLTFPVRATADAAAARRLLHLGVMRIEGADRLTAAQLLRERPVDLDSDGDLLLELTRALAGTGVEVRPVPLGGYAWARPTSAAQLEAAVTAVDAVDERTVRLREAARGGDGFYSTFVLRRISWRFTGMAERIGLTPNQVTVISFGLGLLAAGCLAVGSRPWAVAGALLLQFCLVIDCVDGELARFRRRFSRFGAWLDATTDRVKEFAAIGALAVAGARHDQDLWWLVAAAITLQTFRNLLDLGWSRQRAPIGGSASPDAVEWVGSASWVRPPVSRPPGPGALSWLRRVGHFPIGERFLLISLGAALATPRLTLIALLVAGLLSAGYMLAAFAVRSRPGDGAGRRIADLVDSGPVLGAVLRNAIGTGAGRLVALVPGLVAVAELALIWWLAVEVAGARPVAAAVLVAVTAIAHYQQAYGVREEAAAEPGGFVIGTDLRLVALVLVVVVPALLLPPKDAEGWATSAVWALAGLVAISSTMRSLQAWTGPNGPDAAGPDGRNGQKRHNEVPIDRMQTVNAETGMMVPCPASGGFR
jgi:hypothetical protein